MKQNEENSQKAQKLTKEELEQVNGGDFLKILEEAKKKKPLDWTESLRS